MLRRELVNEALQAFLRPGSIAVVGASEQPSALGGLLFANLLASGFDGTLYPVNPKHHRVRGVVAYPDLSSCPATPELVVVAVPAPVVAGIVKEAGKVGAKAICVISAGFAEAGDEGRELQADLVNQAREAGVRLIGPNCMGLANAADPRFNATFSPTIPSPGRMGFMTQSGGLGIAVLALLNRSGLGLSAFVSVGNAADVGPDDLLEYFEGDAATSVVLAYLESVPDPPRFAQVARRLTRHKPLVVLKAGRSDSGRRAAASHTAALAAGEQVVQALFHQTGVLRVDTLAQMVDVGAVAARYRTPGRRVAVLTNVGGPGILAADACEAAGLTVPELAASTRRDLRARLPALASVANPVDMIAGASTEDYGRSLGVLMEAEEIDAVIVVFTALSTALADDVARQVVAAAERSPDKAVVATFLTAGPLPGVLFEAGIPCFSSPEGAATALGRVAQWAEWRRRPPGRLLTPAGIDRARAAAAVAGALDRSSPGGWAEVGTASELLEAYGIALVGWRRVTTPEEAATAQVELGGKVAVKIAAPIHKSDVGGVLLDIEGPQAAAAAVTAIRTALAEADMADQGRELVVQEQVRDGLEMIVGVVRDRSFGPLVLTGLGGTTVELLGDVALRLAPLTDLDVEEMLRSLRCYPMLTGYRNRPPLDLAAFSDLLGRVSAMVSDNPEISELDLNPVFVRPRGAVVADVRLRLAE